MKNPERMLGVFNKRNKARLLPYARIISQVEGYDLSLSAPLAHDPADIPSPPAGGARGKVH